MTFQQLFRQIESRQWAPVYFLFGQEQFFLDKLVAALEENVLAGADRSFNLDVLYGNEASGGQIVGLCRQYPTMATHRLVIAKEAHRIRKDQFDLLATYLEKPTPSTVLALVWPDKRGPDARTRFGKAVDKHAEVFESKPIYENKVPEWIDEQLKAEGLSIAPDAALWMASALGANLGLIENELAKMKLHLKATKQDRISRELVHEFVAIDKDFNIFELQEKLGMRKAPQAMDIISHMARNLKENPAVMVVSQLFGYYVKLGILLQEGIRTEADAAKALGMNPFIARQYLAAARQHSYPVIRRNLELLLQADLELKGVVPTRMGEEHILQTLVLRLSLP